MLGPAIHERLTHPEFQPFTLVLASGERIEVRHPDSVTLASIEFRGKRVYASSLTVLETRENAVIERAISLPLIAQVVTDHRLNGH
ncbi:MAG: hypothetical protein WD749_07190 [Phycisphaerales bacterium]